MGNTASKARTLARMSVRSPRQLVDYAVMHLRRHPAPVYVGDGLVLTTTRERHRLLVEGQDLAVSPWLIVEGIFDEPFTFYLRRTLQAGDTYVDVGANVGHYVVTAGRAVGPTGRVVAYEPAPRMIELLRRNIVMNWVHGWVRVRPVAVGAAAGVGTLGVPDRNAGAAGLGITNVDDAVEGTEVTAIEVPVVCLDDDLAGSGVIRILKLDIEGGEGAVLEGMRTLIAERRVRTIVLEVNQIARGRVGNDDGWHALVRELRALDRVGYTWSTIDRVGGTRHIALEQALEMQFLSHLVGDAPG